MDLFLQFGYGMMQHSELLIKKWGNGSIVLSPRDLKLEQMKNLQKKLSKVSGSILLDPQFYIPRCDHDKLVSHSFWPQSYDTSTFFQTSGIRKLLSILYNDYNLPLSASAFIIPGLYCNEVTNDWKKIHELIINEVHKLNIEIPKIATLCISSEVLLSQDSIHDIIDFVENWDVEGFYIVPEHPRDTYLVDNPNWLLNLLDLCAGLKLNGKQVIVGYSNHQNLCLALAKVDAICSGTWVNVRMFTKGKFHNLEDSFGQRSVWYYCPQALTEYQVNTLGIAYKLGVLSELKTNDIYESNFADILFQGADPTAVKFSEREAFRHYLQSLKFQVNSSCKNSFDDTLNSLKLQLKASQDLTEYFSSRGIRGKYRDFSIVVDTTLSILDAFKSLRGLLLAHNWNTL